MRLTPRKQAEHRVRNALGDLLADEEHPRGAPDARVVERFHVAVQVLENAPVDTEPLSPELEAVLNQRVAEVRAGTVTPVQLTIPNEDEEGGTTT